LSLSSFISSGVGRFGCFSGGPTAVAEALRLDPEGNCDDDDMVDSNLPLANCLHP